MDKRCVVSNSIINKLPKGNGLLFSVEGVVPEITVVPGQETVKRFE